MAGINHAWISPLDFIDKMKYYNLRFDAVSVHPYAPRIYASPLEAPPAGAITLANLDLLLQKMRDLYPADSGKWHIVLGEYFQHSYYGSRVASSAADDQGPGIGCPNYFCASTSEGNLKAYLQEAYGTSGSDKSYLDYLMWSMWNNIDGYTGGLVRRDGTNKTEGTVGGSVRQAFTDIAP